MKKIMLIVILAAATGITFGQSPKVTIAIDCAGATTKDNFDLFTQILLDGDETAFNNMLRQGKLVLLKKDEVVTFINASIFGGWTKIRKKGSTKLLYVNSEFVAR